MSETITMTEEQWAELKARAWQLEEQARQLAAESSRTHLWTPAVFTTSYNLRAFIAEVEARSHENA